MDTFLYGQDKKKKHQHGVAVLIKKEHIKGLDINQDVLFVSDRILQINLRIQGSTLSIISVYAPTNVSEIEQKLEFYDQLQEITTNVSKKNCCSFVGISMRELAVQATKKTNGMEYLVTTVWARKMKMDHSCLNTAQEIIFVYATLSSSTKTEEPGNT